MNVFNRRWRRWEIPLYQHELHICPSLGLKKMEAFSNVPMERNIRIDESTAGSTKEKWKTSWSTILNFEKRGVFLLNDHLMDSIFLTLMYRPNFALLKWHGLLTESLSSPRKYVNLAKKNFKSASLKEVII